ncbi:hypothetical protein [Deinococcus puniceus]|uniref:Uncharacterized protein n=1 Tax=Deinococcus puniceus TaxID=1182568 RepID=A0A172TBK2_9DEIO|nr:hypothetical protein [Deinococcus puniceus]ANE44361.1 hypothetical protein SU48_11970 [Deinococcus puniceus]
MGGHLFHFPRLPRAEYLQREGQVRAVLHEFLPATPAGPQWFIPHVHADKPDFGDLDVLVSRDALTAPFLAEFRARLGITQTRRVKGIESHDFGGFQVDLMATPPAELRTRFEFMSWGDLGNILGRMMRPLGLKWGESGLLYVYRRPDEAHYLRTYTVSLSIDAVMQAAGLDAAHWHAGFETEAAMFGWAAGASRFSARPYLSPEGDFGRRILERPGLQRFADYLEGAGWVAPLEREPNQPPEVLFELFPQSGLAAFLGAEAIAAGRDRVRRGKFSGRLVMALRPELSGKLLGLFMQAFTARPDFWDWVDAATTDEIADRIRAAPAPLNSPV